ncbi:MAG TPA: 5-oxoprolinase subunit PxpB [Candidatus Limnocylindria bacterium]|nr:5-oxoprolinase subunit PxpB [Candidatus Limnocylindria bacterium]
MSETMAIAYGPDALLVRFAEAADEAAFLRAQALVAELRREPFAGLREIIPAFTTLLLDFEAGTGAAGREEVLRFLRGLRPDFVTTAPVAESRLAEIPVDYDGPDLARVAVHAGLRPEQVIARHAAPTYRVHCLGFAPGFPYLGGLDPRLATPRLASPRLRVPAGSVAIGGGHTGIYSVPSPGGWNLLGTTDVKLFDPRATSLEEMFRLRAGDRLRFLPKLRCEGEGTSEEDRESRSRLTSAATDRTKAPAEAMLRVLSPGLGAGLQDLGRPGFARFGVPPGGAMDPHAAAWANRLLDNPPSAAVLELCLQGQRFEVLRPGWLAVTGSSAPSGQAANHAFRVRIGDVLEFPPGSAGVWTYLAVPGGFAGELVLGSASVNPRAGIGSALAAGDEVAVAGGTHFDPPEAVAGRAIPWSEVSDFGRPPVLRVWPGPQWGSFGDADWDRLFAVDWSVTSQCDRVGYRLAGPVLQPQTAQIISEPVLPGTIQVPANGQPIVTMPDGPTIGGYPKLGIVDPADLFRLAQCRAGQRVRFVPAG